MGVDMRNQSWTVPYQRTCHGQAEIEASSLEEARAKVEQGDFEPDPGEEMVDWALTGRPRCGHDLLHRGSGVEAEEES